MTVASTTHAGNQIICLQKAAPIGAAVLAALVGMNHHLLLRFRRRTPDVERLRLRSRVSELFTQSRSAAGSRSILSLMLEDGEQLGRFKVLSLMRELDLVRKQPGSHAYKRATVERVDIPSILNREFDVPAPNQVWCGDITYIWAQGKWH